jgi:hypothetical protein
MPMATPRQVARPTVIEPFASITPPLYPLRGR